MQFGQSAQLAQLVAMQAPSMRSPASQQPPERFLGKNVAFAARATTAMTMARITQLAKFTS
ncbi:MAG TPA: hypothetical protein DCP91_02030 [Eggerthellaceae bacterium]|nr:hypothetical protein [Eggerthellaceae bacterium]